MKLKVRNIILQVLMLFLTSAILSAQGLENFYFKEAQPRGEDGLTRFPTAIRGLYKSVKDSSKRLVISSDSVSIEIPMVQYATISELETKKYIFHDSVVIKPNGVRLPCLLKNDTLYFVDFAKSLLFAIDDNHILKKVDDKFVLSKLSHDGKWECTLLYMENQQICLAYFDFEKKLTDIEKNKKILKIKSEDGNHYLANFKLKEFIKIMDQNYFPGKQYFYKKFDWQ